MALWNAKIKPQEQLPASPNSPISHATNAPSPSLTSFAGREIKTALDAARELVTAERYDEARRAFEAILEQNPQVIAAYIGIGNLCARQAQYDEALEYYAGASHLNQQLPLPYLLSGMVHVKRDQLDQAITQFEQALQLDAKLSEARIKLSRLYLRTQRDDDALMCLDEAIRQSPQLEEARLLRAQLFAQRGDLTAAICELKIITTVDKTAWQSQTQLARLYFTQQDYAAALVAIQAALEIQKNDPQLQFILGLVCYQLGEYSLAQSALSTALELKPTLQLADVQLVQVLIAQDQLTEARQRLITLSKGKKHLPKIHYLLAMIGLQQHRYPEAVAEFEAVLLHAPDILKNHPELTAISTTVATDQARALAYDVELKTLDLLTVRLLPITAQV
ncbi:tetratricopeptide repeat protein [Rhodoferax sp. 4810]|uniref:Tetratricopeptide repeat protein n=1 Tax=Thiospirillum jenense TaxID=1653858 RepID=A0A839HHQ8_9GAMM|nr:tetratricopeptide repeat protein [Thiospirillum jenense]MBB1073360.1 tetratricopeptide repeat protein [Rhodoferax jenense]MBB1125712.1 tetratricopeptide repeat protein [Thiospirillum jenense]